MGDSVKTYITYFDDHQIDEFNLKEDENTTLFKGNDTSYEGDSINHLNVFYCELCTFYYVWKNNMKSDILCFKQYRRPFNWEQLNRLPKEGEVICYDSVSVYNPIILQYAVCHGNKRAYDLMGVLKNMYGMESDVYRYFTRSNKLYTNNSIVLGWDDFVKMCEFVFGTLDYIDKFYGLGYNYEKYALNARKYTEDNRYEYQMHWVAYIGERLVSCYIDTCLKPLTIPRLENNGFFKPYKPKTGD